MPLMPMRIVNYDAKLNAKKAGVAEGGLIEDLNKDGIVNIEDFNFVEKNFMTINPYVTTTNKPIEKIGNTTIEELKKRFN